MGALGWFTAAVDGGWGWGVVAAVDGLWGGGHVVGRKQRGTVRWWGEGLFSISMNIDCFRTSVYTYGHRLLKTRLPVRSAKDKPQIG